MNAIHVMSHHPRKHVTHLNPPTTALGYTPLVSTLTHLMDSTYTYTTEYDFILFHSIPRPVIVTHIGPGTIHQNPSAGYWKLAQVGVIRSGVWVAAGAPTDDDSIVQCIRRLYHNLHSPIPDTRPIANVQGIHPSATMIWI